MNWFERHLNGTLVLVGFIGAFVVWRVLAWLAVWVVFVRQSFVGSETAMEIAESSGEWAGLFFGLATLMATSVWHLQHKGRSMRYLACLLVPPVALVVFLCLENKRSPVS